MKLCKIMITTHKQLLILALLSIAIMINAEPSLKQQINNLNENIASSRQQQNMLKQQAQTILQTIKAKEQEKYELTHTIKQLNYEHKKFQMLHKNDEHPDHAQVKYQLKKSEFNLEQVNIAIQQLHEERKQTRIDKRVLQNHMDETKLQLAGKIKTRESSNSQQLNRSVESPTHDLNIKIADISAIINAKEKIRDGILSSIKEISDNIEKNEINKSTMEIELKTLRHNEKKLTLLDKEKSDLNQLKSTQYEIKKAEFSYNKSKSLIPQLYENRSQQKKASRILKHDINDLHNQLALLQVHLDQNQRLLAQHKREIIEQEERVLHQADKVKTVTKSADNDFLDELSTEERLTFKARQRDLLIRQIALLPPARAAVNWAKVRALDEEKGEAPLLGIAPNVSNTDRETTRVSDIGQMTHIGNHQYTLIATVHEGEQEFIIGEHRFNKYVPKEFDGETCIFIVDARNEHHLVVQIVVAETKNRQLLASIL